MCFVGKWECQRWTHGLQLCLPKLFDAGNIDPESLTKPIPSTYSQFKPIESSQPEPLARPFAGAHVGSQPRQELRAGT